MKNYRFLGVFLTVFVLAALLCVITPKAEAATVASGTCGAEGDNLTWTLDDEGTLTISGTGAMASWTSSNSAPWYSYRSSVKTVNIKSGVTTIGNSAFYYCTDLTSVTIPDSVTTIGSSAFYNCTGLTSVTIGDGVTSIGDSAFDCCTGLTSVTIGDGVTSIGSSAFYNCTGLTSVTIPDSVTTIGSSAFYNCTGLTSVTIPDSVTSIGGSAFYSCTGLTTVTIGDGVTSIGSSAFYNCTGLTSVTIGDSVTSIGSYAFKSCTGLTTVTIGDGVTSIGSYAFYNCTGLTSVTIPDSVNSIGQGVFRGCSAMESITIPFVGESRKTASDTYQYPLGYLFGSASYTGSVAIQQYYHGSSINSTTSTTYYIPSKLKEVTVTDGYIPYGAFEHCTGLTSVTIGDGVTSIGSYAFKNCTGLTSVTIPDSVTSIGGFAFENCTGLTSVTIGDGVTGIGGYAFYNCTGLTSVTIGNGVTSIGDSAFYNCTGLTSVTIPDSVTSIGGYAFKNCTGLISVTIPDSVTSIGGSAFYDCTGLTSVTIGDGVTGISGYAFYDCTGLTSVTIGDGVTSIGDSAFENCTGLTSVTIPDSVNSIGREAFGGCSAIESITIPFVGESRKTASNTYQYPFGYIFGSYSYAGSVAIQQYYYGSSINSTTSTTYYIPSKLKEVTVTDGYIPYGAFYNCKGLTSVTIGDGVTSIGNSAFYNCTGLTSVTIGDSVTSIGNSAFYNCTGLTLIALGKNVNRIENNAFYNCTNITDIYIYDIDACNKIVFGSNANPLKYPHKLYLNGNLVTEFRYPEGITSIESNATFRNCTSLTSIIIPDSVTHIGGSAFSGCTGLTAIDIPNSVISIGASAFENCSGLTSVTIPESVTYIGGAAFSGCTGLTEINFCATNMMDMESTAFYAAGKNGAGIKLTIGEQVTRIPAYMFGTYSTSSSGSPKITTVEFIGNSKCTSIGQYAFYNCDSLTAIAILDSVQEIEAYAFNDCGSLYTIDLPQKPIIIRPYAFHKSGYYMQYYKNAMVVVDNHVVYIKTSLVGALEIPEGVITIADNAASSSQIGAVILPESLIRIGDRAFAGCRDLDEIIIPESVEYIGNNAFSSTSIQAIHIPAATVHLGEEFVIRGGTETTKGIQRITVAEGNPVYHSFEGSLIKTKEQVLWIGGSGIPDDGSVTTIASGAFMGDQSSIRVIPEGITTIEAGAFASCKMNTLYLPASVTEIQQDAFSSCNQLRYVYYNGDKASWDDLMEKEPHENLMKANVHFSIESDVELENEYTHTLIVPEGYTGIYTVEDLYNIRNDLNGKYILMNHIVFKSEDYEEGGICHSGYGWLPIGASADEPFTGVIDGNGYAIYGLYIDYSLVEEFNVDPYVGIVGYNAGTICNLGIMSGKITTTEPVYGDLFVGGIAGCNVGTIKNCFNNAMITGSSNKTSGYTNVVVCVGGIVGSSEYGGVVENCKNYGTVYASGYGSNISSASACAAGIAGKAKSISKCANYGNITASNSEINKSVAAGIVAYGGTITECTNMGSIKAAQAAGISYSATNISYCLNAGNVRAEGENEIYAGGIAIQNASVVSCGNIGMVSSAASVLEVSGPNMCAYAAGIIVETDKQVSDCFNAGNVSAYSGNGGSSIAYAGGISAIYTAQSMINCYNIGTLPINNPAYYKYYGDLAGYGGFDATGCVYVGDFAIGYGGSAQNALQSDLESMKDKTIYKGFNFDSVWTLDANAEYPYPTIQGQKMSYSIKLLGIVITEYPQKLSYNRGEKLSLEGLKVYAYYTDGASQPIVHYDIIGDTSNQGKNTITIDYFGARTSFNIYVNTPSWDGSEIGGYVQLQNDTDVNIGLNADLYIDLNGFDLTGTIETNGYKIYGMDSTTDSYSCDSIGYFNCVDENGKAIIPVTHFKSDITGSTKRYMAIKDENGYNFHRFYLGITHMNLRPGTTGVGYKAVFYGDEMVAANLDSFGFTMTLGGCTPKTAMKAASSFVSGKTVTLRIDNYDVVEYSQTDLTACVVLKLADGTVIESTAVTMTFRGLMEQLNANYTALTSEQLNAVAEMIKKYAIIISWDLKNLFAL